METETCHYVRIDIAENGERRVFYVQEFFDLADYLKAQGDWARDDLLNHHGLRVKMGWSQDRLLDELQKDPGLLFRHFIEYHGHDWFRDNIRPRFVSTKTQLLENPNVLCLTAKPEDYCMRCDICLIVHAVNKVQDTLHRKIGYTIRSAHRLMRKRLHI
jgi:hypothetical protein